MRVSTRTMFEDCYGAYAIAAVNVFNMEQVLALFQAAEEADAPFIVQATPYARNFAGPPMLAAMIGAAAELFPDAVYAFHLDHGDESHCRDAIPTGDYASVMIDASHDPFDDNVRRTRAVVELAHAHGVAVEAELGVLSGVEDGISVEERLVRYTDPAQCEAFVNQTGCDSLAVAVGTSHGAYKFSGGNGLQFDILEAIGQRLPGFPLVLHGASTVNESEIDRINGAGGRLLPGARGVSPDELIRAIERGVCKVNIATDTRLLWARTYREFFRDQPDQIDLVLPAKQYIDEYVVMMKQKFELLGASHRAFGVRKKHDASLPSAS
ncbi:MAG: class II fructose-bisphosphate aldolase [Rhodothermales bacterium]